MLRDRDGNVALQFAILAPALLAAAGVGIDFQRRVAQTAALQDAADTLALRGARELLLQNATAASVESLIRAWADAQYATELGAFTVTPDVDDVANTVHVSLEQPKAKGFFLTQAVSGGDPVSADATAQARGVSNVCIVALEDAEDNAISATFSSKLDAPECAVLSNSTSSRGVSVSGLAKVSAKFICSAGGASGGSTNFSPAPLTDCPTYEDPLAERTPPQAGPCDYNAHAIGTPPSLTSALETLLASAIAGLDGSQETTLAGYARHDIQPGVYCGGLAVNDKSDVHLAPGVYVIRDGQLKVGLGARLYGEGVTFFLDGEDATFLFEPASIVHLTAPKEGLMAGLLFFESKEADEDNVNVILSSNARELLGTIYLPRSTLQVATLMPVGDKSAYTAIVARRIAMSGSPTLVLNADYADTDVPVPDGIGPTGGQVFLRD